MSNDETQSPVRESGKRIALCSNFDREDLGGIHPSNDTDHGEEEGEDEVHGDHSAQSVRVCGSLARRKYVVLAEDGVDEEGKCAAGGGNDHRLYSSDLVEQEKPKRAPDNGQGAGDADNLERCMSVDAEQLVDARAVVVDHLFCQNMVLVL